MRKQYRFSDLQVGEELLFYNLEDAQRCYNAARQWGERNGRRFRRESRPTRADTEIAIMRVE